MRPSLGRILSSGTAVNSKRFFSVKHMNGISVSQFGDPDVLKYTPEMAIPSASKDQYVIKMEAVGVNPVDTYIRAGTYGKLPALPFTPGKDGAGVIHQVGEGCTEFKKGDRVYMFGALSGSYAEYSLCSATNTFSLPVGVSFAQGACLGTPGFTAYRALFTRGLAKPNQTVLVHGASGGVGLFAVQMAKAAGMKVVGTAGTEEGLQAIKEAGACAVFNHRKEGYLEEVKAHFPDGYDLCLEMLASSNLGNDLGLMSVGGRVVVVGSRGPVQINPRDIMSKELTVTAVMLLASTPAELAEAAAYMNAGLAAGTLGPVVSLEMPLSKANEAHTEVIAKKSTSVGNIVMIP